MVSSMAKAANFYSVVLTHEAQMIKLSNDLLVLRLSFFTLTGSSKISVRIKWGLTSNDTVFNIYLLVLIPAGHASSSDVTYGTYYIHTPVSKAASTIRKVLDCCPSPD